MTLEHVDDMETMTDLPAGLSLQKWPIDKLRPYERNAREITDEAIVKLAATIETLGFLDPIEVTASGEIVAGHRRLMAAKRLGLRFVPVLVHETMTADEAKAYRIANNKLSEDVKWNRAFLSDELLAIENFVSPEMLGFGEKDLVKLFDLDDGPPASKPGEEAEKLPGPFLVRGERWVIGPCTIEVWKNVTDDGLRKLETTIPKLEKILGHKALLDGDEASPFKLIITSRMDAEAAQ